MLQYTYIAKRRTKEGPILNILVPPYPVNLTIINSPLKFTSSVFKLIFSYLNDFNVFIPSGHSFVFNSKLLFIQYLFLHPKISSLLPSLILKCLDMNNVG